MGVNTNFPDAFEVAKEELEGRNWVLIDPDDEKACKETLKTNLDQKAAGIPRIHSAFNDVNESDNESNEPETSTCFITESTTPLERASMIAKALCIMLGWAWTFVCFSSAC